MIENSIVHVESLVLDILYRAARKIVLYSGIITHVLVCHENQNENGCVHNVYESESDNRIRLGGFHFFWVEGERIFR